MAVSERSAIRAETKHSHDFGEDCPWCGQPIPHDKFEEIKARIAKKERERFAEHERQLQNEFTKQKAADAAKAKAEIERLQKEAASREAKARDEVKKATEKAMNAQVSEAVKAKEAAETQVKSLKAEKDRVLKERLQEQRAALEKDKTRAVNKERSKFFEERQKLESKVQDLQRQLEDKNVEELGEGAEIDLFEDLKERFEEDRIRRINKGQPGADIVHEVVHNGEVCGQIIYDSKNHKSWRNDFVNKLRKDQLAAKADHAILSTNAFPAGNRQVHIQDGVLVLNPARVVVLAQMVRRHIIQTHSLRLSGQAREKKTEALYDFINSERCVQLLEQIEATTDKMMELDVKEQKSHETTWKQRGVLIGTVQKAFGDFSTEIDRIIGTTADDK